MIFLSQLGRAETISENYKQYVYEIRSPGAKRGTALAIHDSLLGDMLVTCRHVITDSTGRFYDSILVRKNVREPSGQMSADTTEYAVHLVLGQVLSVVEHPLRDVDLVVFPLGGVDNSGNKDTSISCLPSENILGRDSLEKLGVGEGLEVELIGFSLSSSLPPGSVHYHFTRFGKISLYNSHNLTLPIMGEKRTAHFMLVDLNARPGDSGSPIFAGIGGRTYLIGIVTAMSQSLDYAIGYPIYYLKDLLEIIRGRVEMMKMRSGKK
jgi:hypothetical protein